MATFKFEQLPQVMRVMAKAIPANAQKVMGTAARVFGRAVVNNTPVDIGDARAGWVASVGTPSAHINFAFVPNKQLGSAAETLAAGRFADIPNAAGAIAQHNTALLRFSKSKPGISFFYTNNHPYIVPLEQGTLRGGQTLQNVAGWVERSIILAAETALRQDVIPKSAGGGGFKSFSVKIPRGQRV